MDTGDRKQFVFVERKKALQLAESCGLGIVHEEAYLVGYQIHIIEQWVCDRSIASNTVKVFTGDQNHRIKVCVISISAADLQHPRPEIQDFFNTGTPVKLKSTPLGEIMLTDPSELPSYMDMVLVPDGDYDKWINQAYVNINLRRTNCTGRSSLNLQKPNPASEEKFRSIYKIAASVPFESAVIKLVTVAQVALYLFNLLKKDYIDGLICNETTNALWEFYTKYNPYRSRDYQLKEPWMEPHLLTALITKLIVCRNKLHAYNFTTIKDPFADYEQFRFDIEEYQRVKNLKRTKVIDLETLEKLNEYSIGQLKVRSVIKSKLDDISGVSSSPLFKEFSDPEVFRHHATIESLRAIWRPRLKSSSGSDSDKPQHEFIHMIKGVSARTTRTSGAAAEILSKFAGSLPWVDGRHYNNVRRTRTRIMSSRLPPRSRISQRVSGRAREARNRLPRASSPFTPGGTTLTRSSPAAPQEIPPNVYTRLGHEAVYSSDDELSSESNRYDSDLPGWRRPSGRLNQNLPHESSAEAQRSISPPLLHPDLSSSGSDEEHCDCVPYRERDRFARRARSVSDSVIASYAFASPNVVGLLPSADANSAQGIHTHDPLLHRTQSLSMIPDMARNTDDAGHTSDSSDVSSPPRPSVVMDIETYLVYEKLQRQQLALRQAYSQLKRLSSAYEQRANQLRMTYLRRFSEFEQVERAARQAIDEQRQTDRRLREAEDDNAKLHYELNVLNEHLRDVEDNISIFYGKLTQLEHKMHDSEQSVTTLLIIGNYFTYYWKKLKCFLGWEDTRPVNVS